MRFPENDLPAAILQHLPDGVLDELRSLPEPEKESEAKMVAEVKKWLTNAATFVEQMTNEGGRLRNAVKSCLCDGTLAIRQVAKAARRYREIDVAARQAAIELLDHVDDPLDRVSLRSFLQDALDRDITVDAQARPDLIRLYQRDIAICVLVANVMIRWHLRKNRAAIIVSKALNENNFIPLSDRRIREIYDNLHLIAGRLASLIVG
jgi:hypothetical protein